MVLSNPCFEKCEKYHVFRSFHRNGTSYSTVPSFVNILNHSWLKIWGIWRRKYRFFFYHFQISSIHASWPSLWTAFTHHFPIWKVSMSSWSDHAKLREARERFYKAWRWQAQRSQYNTPSISEYFAVCSIENRDKNGNKTDRKSHPDRNLFSFSLPYGTKHFREEEKERRITPSVRMWSVIC